MTKIVGPISGQFAFGADTPSPFQDRTLTLEDGVWTENTDEEGLISRWGEQLRYMGLSFPISCPKTTGDLKCFDCGEAWNYLHHMEFIDRGKYSYTYDAVCPKCQTRAAVTGEAVVH